MEGFRMAPLAKIPAERPGVLVCTPLSFALAMGAGSPSGRLFSFRRPTGIERLHCD